MHASDSGRRKRRAWGGTVAAWLALFSLLLQFSLTAGHFHPEDFAALSGLAHPGSAVAASRDHDAPPANAILHDDCALCLSVQIAGSAALAAAASPNIPTVLSAVALEPVAALPRNLPAHLLFQTRAPPIV